MRHVGLAGVLVLTACGASPAPRAETTPERRAVEPAPRETVTAAVASTETTTDGGSITDGEAALEPATTRAEPSPECVADLAAITEAMAASREGAACRSAAGCRVVMGPRHPDPEYAEVVAAADAAVLERRSSAHIERCGASAYHVAIDAFRVVEAGCEAGRCVAVETTFHVEE